jgi:hypothetical protein
MFVTKMAVFWVAAPFSLVEVYQRFRGPPCISPCFPMKFVVLRFHRQLRIPTVCEIKEDSRTEETNWLESGCRTKNKTKN